MFIKATITEVDTVIDSPLKFYFLKDSGEKFISFESCGDDNIYQLRGRMKIGDSLIKNVRYEKSFLSQSNYNMLNLHFKLWAFSYNRDCLLKKVSVII